MKVAGVVRRAVTLRVMRSACNRVRQWFRGFASTRLGDFGAHAVRAAACGPSGLRSAA